MMRSMVYEVAENGSNLDQFILPNENLGYFFQFPSSHFF